MSDSGSPPPSPRPAVQQVLDNVRQLVKNQTRFEPSAVNYVIGQEVQQVLVIRTAHQLKTKLLERKITGKSILKGNQRESSNPSQDAASDIPMRMQETIDLLRQTIAAAPSTHVPCDGDLFTPLLPRATVHWRLDSCQRCRGEGYVSCPTCSGQGREVCPTCHGSRRVLCGVGCGGSGRVFCHWCRGSGQVPVTVYVSEPRTVYSNGSPYTTYDSVARTEYHNCHTCGGAGKTTCVTCGGLGHVACNTCDRNGQITCRSCGGHGELTCEPCEASGKTGSSFQAVVENTREVSVLVPNRDVDLAALPIVKKVGASAATAMLLKKIEDTREQDARTAEVVVSYSASMRIVHLDVKCNDKKHHVVAYGQNLEWHDTGRLIETLIADDLISLEKAVAENQSKGVFSSDVDSVLTALVSVAASEINVSATETPVHDSNGTAVSMDVADRIRRAVTASVCLVYKRLAARYWWMGTVASLVGATAGWLAEGTALSFAAGCGVGMAIPLLFAFRVRRVLSMSLNSEAVARRLVAAVERKHVAGAFALVSVPAIALPAAIVFTLPHAPPWTKWKAQESAAAVKAPANPQPSKNAAAYVDGAKPGNRR